MKKRVLTLTAAAVMLSTVGVLGANSVSADTLQNSIVVVAKASTNDVMLKTPSGNIKVSSSDADISQTNNVNIAFSFPDNETSYAPAYSQVIRLTIQGGTFSQGSVGVMNDATHYSYVNATIPPDSISIPYKADSVDTPVVISVSFEGSSQKRDDPTKIEDLTVTDDLTIPVIDQALINAKTDANNQIDQFENLTNAEKSNYKTQISAAKSISDVNTIVTDAKQTDATEFADYKTNIKSQIEKLDNLSSDKKAQYEGNVDAATDRTKVDDLLAQATAEDLNNKKVEVKNKITALLNLSESEKDGFNSQVDSATSTANVDDILKRAQEKDADDLTSSQTSANQAIDNLNNLTSGEKDGFKNQVNAATDIDDVHKILDQANAADALAKAKSDAKTSIDKLTYLNTDEADNYKERIDNETNTADIQNIIDEATEQNAANQAAKELADKKTDAKKQIADLTYLTEEEKKDYSSQVDDAKSKVGVDSALDEAKGVNADRLKAAQDEAKNKIDNLPYLSDQDKQDYKDQIDAAINGDDINQIVTDATDKNTSLKLEPGDLNGDKSLTAADLSLLTAYIQSPETFTLPNKVTKAQFEAAADVNGDGKITGADISLLASLIAKP